MSHLSDSFGRMLEGVFKTMMLTNHFISNCFVNLHLKLKIKKMYASNIIFSNFFSRIFFSIFLMTKNKFKKTNKKFFNKKFLLSFCFQTFLSIFFVQINFSKFFFPILKFFEMLKKKHSFNNFEPVIKKELYLLCDSIS